MPSKKRPPRYWTEERVLAAARTCQSRWEFSRKFRGAYESATRNGWFARATSHMICHREYPHNWWTRKRVAETASRYVTRSDFYYYSKGAYNAARALGIADEVCAHMEDGRKGGNRTLPHNGKNGNEISKRAFDYALELGLIDADGNPT